jgi:hypothetical protein
MCEEGEYNSGHDKKRQRIRENYNYRIILDAQHTAKKNA